MPEYDVRYKMASKIYHTPKEWYQCMDQGVEAVRRPYQVPQFLRNGIPHLTIYHVPSFSDAKGWVVYKMRHNEGLAVQCVRWHQTEDGKRIERLMKGESESEPPDPTLSESFCSIEEGWYQDVVAELRQIAVPLYTDRPIGLDGESFGIHMRGQFDAEWWCEGPEEWKGLIGLVQRCIEHFENQLSEQAVAPNR